MNNVYLSLGSNLGDKEENIKNAVLSLGKRQGIKLKKVSPMYETKPVGYKDQDMFLNIAIQIETDLDPYKLLEIIHEIEKEMKRERIIRWGPRTIDIDILLYNEININNIYLTIPHPRMWERAFVLIPLSNLNPYIKKNDIYIKDLIEKLTDKNDVVMYKNNWYKEVQK
ncbi:MAG: 2-amino-4-hydroxy-6-hydroxymethyldihydropteridine diphosphokinase [Thermoanaerobacteraceae bacterium]